MERQEHPNLVHVDDVAPEALDVGELRATRFAAGEAAGAFRAGVTRARIEPGGRSSPVHVHGDEEELFHVLGGTGLSWQDGVTFEIGPGDSLVHRVHEEAHTLIAGPDGLDVLGFGTNSEANVTWLPHAGVMRVGPHWVPADVRDPFEAERDAGPLPVPDAPTTPRPPTIAHLDDVPGETFDRPGYEGTEQRIGEHLGAQTTGLRRTVLAPGALSCPPHWHTAEEEIFYVLDGSGEALLDDATFAVRPGSVLVRPPGTRVAHALRGGPDGLTYLGWGTRVHADLVYYPRSRKLNVHGLCFRVEPVDYWDGE